MEYKHSRISRARKVAALLGTASVFTTASVAIAQAQETASGPIEQVLVTGSLIRGAAAVGVPVTALSDKDFSESGAVTVADMFQNVPAIVITPTQNGAAGHAQAAGGQQISIHNLDTPSATRELMLVDGMRFPPQGLGSRQVDPSIIPSIALERVDILADGASATYGSDAITGVVNLIMKRGFNGAEVQVRGGYYDGGKQYQASTLWGRTWDGGDITLSYEWWDVSAIKATKRSGYTTDYTPWGLDDRTPIASSLPGVVSTGKPSTGTYGSPCTNCYSIPAGSDGVGLTWAALLAHPGATNEVNVYKYADAFAARQSNAATLTFDQRLLPGLKVYGEAFYRNSRIQDTLGSQVCTSCLQTYAVPTSNPYYPVGAPAGLQVSTFTTPTIPPYSSGYEWAGRYNFGLEAELPFGWEGRIFDVYSVDTSNAYFGGATNPKLVNALLGNTNAASGAFSAYTKPPNIPYLNPFCDPTAHSCYTQSQLDYMLGYRNQGPLQYSVAEKGVNFDGPLFDLPGGPVKAAVGAVYDHFVDVAYDTRNDNTPTPQPTPNPDFESRTVWAIFGQVNVPIFGDMNAIPGFKKLDLEVSWRHDQYNDVGGTSNPKVAVNWQPVDSLTLRGTWGTSFRAPAFTEISTTQSVAIQPQNILSGAPSNGVSVQCTNGHPVAGSAAAAINPNCDPALLFPGGISVQHSAGGALSTGLRAGSSVAPEKSTNIGLGFEFTPTEFLRGLDIQATYYKLHISDLLNQFPVSTASFNDPNYRFTFVLPGDVDQAKFTQIVKTLQALPISQAANAITSNILWINDGAVRNIGYLKVDGIDFNARYDWDWSDMGLGVWDLGIAGSYTLHRKTFSGIAGSPIIDDFHKDQAPEFGIEIEPRLKYRARLGWSDGPWSVVGFANYRSHYFTGESYPPAAYLALFPNYTRIEPSFYTFDLAIGYNTGEIPSNKYLQDIGIQLVVNNITDRPPPFEYAASHNSYNYEQAYDPTVPATGRLIQLTITKNW